MPYTIGETKALLAAILEVGPEHVREFVVIARGKCENCGAEDAYGIIDNFESRDECEAFTWEAFRTFPPEIWEERE